MRPTARDAAGSTVDRQGAARQPRLRPLREHRQRAVPAPRSSSAATRGRSTAPRPLADRAPGRTSPRPTTARRCALFVNGTQVAQLGGRRLDRHLDRRAPDRRQRRLGRVVQRPDRRGAHLQPRARAPAEIQNDMVPSVTPDTTPPTIDGEDARRPARPASTSARSATATFNELDERRARSRRSTSSSRTRRNAVVPATVTLRRGDERRDADAAERAAVRRDLHGRPSRAARAASPTSPGNPLAADSTWSFTTEASPPPILVVGSTREPVRRVPRRDPPQRGPERLHDDRRRVRSRRALLAQFDVVLLGDTPLTPAR